MAETGADKETALIIGAGPGLSASIARLCATEGMDVALAARDCAKLDGLKSEIKGRAYGCDVSAPDQVASLFAQVTKDAGVPDLVVFNPSYRTRGPISDLDPEEVKKTLLVAGFGGFLVGQAAARAMAGRGSGSILFTGASASVKGYVNSAPFAMGKFALRGLVQSMARELAPRNIHVAHFVIDGGISKGPDDPRGADRGPDAMLEPDAIAQTYLHVHRQHRSAWSWEIELRPWVESF